MTPAELALKKTLDMIAKRLELLGKIESACREVAVDEGDEATAADRGARSETWQAAAAYVLGVRDEVLS